MGSKSLSLPLPSIDALPLGAHHLSALTDNGLFEACATRIAFTDRSGGVSSGPYASLDCAAHVGDDPADVIENRRRVLEALGAPDAMLVVPDQVHGTTILVVGESAHASSEDGVVAFDGSAHPYGTEPLLDEKPIQADGVVVAETLVTALLNFADCLPLIVVAPTGDFAVVHAGWRGAVASIASKAVTVLSDVTGCDPAQFNGYIGPHIHEECFEVGPEVATRFQETFGPSVLADERHVSLSRAVSFDMQNAGMVPERIIDVDHCTVCESDRFFSYRATEGSCGRHSAVAVRIP